MKLKVLIRTEVVGGFSASVPALPGCHSQGETLEETLANIREAAELWLEVAAETTELEASKETADSQLREIEVRNRSRASECVASSKTAVGSWFASKAVTMPTASPARRRPSSSPCMATKTSCEKPGTQRAIMKDAGLTDADL